MRSVIFEKPGVMRACLLGVAAFTLSACASLEQYAADLEQRWPVTAAELGLKSTAANEAAPAEVAAAPVPHESLAVRTAKLAKLTPGASCRAIYDLAPSVLNEDRDHLHARLKLAACDYETRDLASARARFKDVLKDDSDPRALKGLALTELRDNRFESALELLEKYNQKTTQSDWQAMNALGFAFDQLGQKDKAEAAYLSAATLSPAHGAPMNNLGMMYMRDGRHADAIRSFSIALNRQPDLEIAELRVKTH